MTFQHLLVEDLDEGRIVRVTVNRPEVLNALNLAAIDELRQVVARVQATPQVSAVILTGAGDRSFVSGGDLKEFQDLTTIAAARQMTTRMKEALAALVDLEAPVIAAINGYALGGGCELAVACDFRIASETAKLGFRQAKVGLISGWGGGPRLLKLVGRSRALRMMLTAEILTAQEALRIGLVDEVTAATDLQDTALALARKIAANAPLATRAFKRLVNLTESAGLAAGLALETELFGPIWVSQDHDEAIAAHFEKRAPRFVGK